MCATLFRVVDSEVCDEQNPRFNPTTNENTDDELLQLIAIEQLIVIQTLLNSSKWCFVANVLHAICGKERAVTYCRLNVSILRLVAAST